MTVLTEQAQKFISGYLSDGDHVIDATAGNGFDTLFLARHVGNEGMVYAFDIQLQAIENTRQLLSDNNLLKRVRLFKQGHELLLESVPGEIHQHISVIMFNLGYLPGADKSCITKTATTLDALNQSMQLLKPAGLLSVMLYPGHPGGQDEAQAVLEWAQQFPVECIKQHIVTKGPQWLLFQQ